MNTLEQSGREKDRSGQCLPRALTAMRRTRAAGQLLGLLTIAVGRTAQIATVDGRAVAGARVIERNGLASSSSGDPLGPAAGGLEFPSA